MKISLKLFNLSSLLNRVIVQWENECNFLFSSFHIYLQLYIIIMRIIENNFSLLLQRWFFSFQRRWNLFQYSREFFLRGRKWSKSLKRIHMENCIWLQRERERAGIKKKNDDNDANKIRWRWNIKLYFCHIFVRLLIVFSQVSEKFEVILHAMKEVKWKTFFFTFRHPPTKKKKYD